MLFPLLTAAILGILVGAFSLGGMSNNIYQTEDTKDTAPSVETTPFPVESDKQRIKRLENEIADLKIRLSLLEKASPQNDNDADTSITETIEITDTSDDDNSADPLNHENLVNAGVSIELASSIIKSLSEQEYKRLQLRDQAIREGYFRSGRYFRELRALNEDTPVLREQIGDDAYDRYLYQTGQNNRVKVSSVMMGSPAEQAGMQDGDIILSYSNEKIFNWNEVRQATSKGALGEYVTVNVIRNDEPISLMLPRGPLGVKLDTTRYQPSDY